MKAVLGVIAIFLLILALLLGAGLVVGVLLHWLVAGIDLGMAVLIGLVATGLAIHLYGGMVGLLAPEDPLKDAIIIDPLSVPFDTIPPLPARRSRRRKSS